MKKNIHSIERVLRIIAGVVLLSFVFWGPSSPWFLLGAIPLLTGILGWCPPYAILGVSTCKVKDDK